VILTASVWFDYPKIKMMQGKWVVDIPQDMEGGYAKSDLHFSVLSEIFDRAQQPLDSESSPAYEIYREYAKYIENTLQKHSNRSFGALILEPVILGAGGMVFVSVCVTVDYVLANST
jgi:bifunctional dethiobiotin synthetase / adenosylmethionine---8-amino-7-oxononanoate aminotransferase